MPKGQRRPIDERILEKQQIIHALAIRVESEQRELNELLEEKRLRNLEQISELISDFGLTTDKVFEILQEYIENRITKVS